MIRTLELALLLQLLLFSLLMNAYAGSDAAQQYSKEDALEISQAAIGNTLNGEYEFINTQGERLRLSSFRGKPLVISLIFTRCHHICPMTTQHLSDIVDMARDVLDDDSFNVITVGFDTQHDTADAMRVFAKQQGVNEQGWAFLSADEPTIKALTKDLGFIYFESGNGFDHLVQASVVDDMGLVYRQVYGIKFNAPQLVEPLKELVFNERKEVSLLSQLSNKIRLFCTVYDPASGRYHFDYSIFMGLVVGLSLGGIMVFWLIKEWRKQLRDPKA